MKTQELKEKGEYLGLCPIKGYLYSVPIGHDKWKIVALKDGRITTLMIHEKINKGY